MAHSGSKYVSVYGKTDRITMINWILKLALALNMESK